MRTGALAGVRSQREVARLLGVSHALVAQDERTAIVKICKELDLPCPYEQRIGPNGRKAWRLRMHPEKT